MARFGKQPVLLPQGVTATVSTTAVTITGPKGTLTRQLPRWVKVEQKENELFVTPRQSTKLALALQGTFKSHIHNMVHGVTEGWTKTLEIAGAGYRAEVQGNKLVLSVGYSHPVIIDAPEGVSFKVEKQTVTATGNDKDVIGQVAAHIRAARPPEPYKGSGIKYTGEVVRRKAGKQAAKGA